MRNKGFGLIGIIFVVGIVVVLIISSIYIFTKDEENSSLPVKQVVNDPVGYEKKVVVDYNESDDAIKSTRSVPVVRQYGNGEKCFADPLDYTTGYLEYTSENFGFTILYPENYSVSFSDDGRKIIIAGDETYRPAVMEIFDNKKGINTTDVFYKIAESKYTTFVCVGEMGQRPSFIHDTGEAGAPDGFVISEKYIFRFDAGRSNEVGFSFDESVAGSIDEGVTWPESVEINPNETWSLYRQ